MSLTTTRIVTGKADTVDFDPLTPELPVTAAQLSEIRRRALADPVIPGTLVSADGRNTSGGYEPVLNNGLTTAYSQPVTVIDEGNPGDTALNGVGKI